MNDVIKHMKEDQVYPCLVFFLIDNPDYGKTFTMSDVRKPTEETYGHCVDNWMTQGRDIPSYEEWAKQLMDVELEDLQYSSTIRLSLRKLAVEKFESIEKATHIEGFVRLIPSELDDYFRNDYATEHSETN
jgi:hypothetical protein